MKTQSRALIGIDQSEAGQAAAVVALFLFFAFLALASLAIDGSMTYLARRDLQNVADSATLAACRVLADGGDSAAARDEAKAVVKKNLGSFEPYAGVNPPTTNQGSGSNLVQGIEVSIPVTGVRVALLRTVPTVLTQFLGRTQSIIDARAMCDSTAGGGLMPIAIQRYDYGGSWRDYLANKYASATDPTAPPYPYPSDTYTVTVADGRYGPFDVPVPKTSPTDFTASDGLATDMKTGPIVSLLGNQAETNDPPNNMSGFVLLDIRNVGAGQCCLEFYNGVDGQANTNKDVSQTWIHQHGYPGPYPKPGSQVAVLSGVSAAFGPQEMADAGYKIGDVIAAIVYDGYVWTKPDYVAQLTPRAANPNGITAGYPNTSGQAVVYDLSIQRAGGVNAKWNNPINFTLTFNFSEAATLPPGTQVEVRDNLGNLVGSTLNGVTEATGWTGTVSIYSPSAGSMPTQTQKYLSGLNVIVDASTGLTHGAVPASGSINYGFGAIGVDFAVSTTTGRVQMRQGDKNTKVDVYTYGTNALSGDCSKVNVTASVVGAGTYTWSSFFSNSTKKTTTITIGKNASNKASFSLDAVDTAPPGSYTLRLTVDAAAGCGSLPHSVELPLEIAPAANSPTNDYVIIQGYALFRISYMDANDVKGYAISPLMFDYKKIKVGLRARLMPWN